VLKALLVRHLPPPVRRRLSRLRAWMRGSRTPLDRVADLWGQTAVQRTTRPIQGWMDSAVVLEECVQPRQSGARQVTWLVGLADRLSIPRSGRWLSLGCGAAGQEIFAVKMGLVGSILALDASPAALDEGRRAAAAQGVTTIEFGSVDLNDPDLPAEAFDVVMMVMSLHHVKELRRVLTQVHRALRPDGYFLINEYIGPRQFQFPDLQLAIVNELLAALPERWRQDSSTGRLKTEYRRMPTAHWDLHDPSEAIRSDLIVTEIERQFRVVERTDYGGTILHLLLEHIVHNFDPADEKDVAVIRLLGRFEDILIRNGVLLSDFTVMAMQKLRDGPAPDPRAVSRDPASARPAETPG
jgi:ubiquinone/menaquinone biosynthesis C-methylase UbiE